MATDKTNAAGKFAIKDIETTKAISKVEKQVKNIQGPLQFKENLSKAKIDQVSEEGFTFDEINKNLVFRKGNKIYKLTATELT